jgi:hypothetical protein
MIRQGLKLLWRCGEYRRGGGCVPSENQTPSTLAASGRYAVAGEQCVGAGVRRLAI